MMDDLAPIAFFVYNRPELTLRTLQHLSRNAEAAESLLYIFCDGPKPGADASQLARVQKVQEVIRQEPWCKEVRIIASDKNKGLADSIIAGVTEVVNRHGRVIVLEDDLMTSPFFLRYMNEALKMYEQEERVLAINGYLYPARLPDSLQDSTFFIRDPGCWGWATWKRAWDLFEPDSRKLYDLIRLKGLSKEFTFWGNYPFMRMFRKQLRGRIDSWAIRWRAVSYLHDKVVLYPAVSLTRHEGNVPEATHYRMGGVEDPMITDVSEKPVALERIPVENNVAMEKVFGKFLWKKGPMSIKFKIKSRLKYYFMRFLPKKGIISNSPGKK